MAGYGTVRTYAELLGQNEMARLLEQTLEGEAGSRQDVERDRPHGQC